MPSPEACGYLIDRWTPRRGTVHSAYTGATNVVWDDGSWWFVVPAGSPHGPCTVTGIGGVAGDSCWMRAGALRIGDRVLRLPSATWTPAPWPAPAPGLRERCEQLRSGSPALARELADGLAAGATITGHGIGLTPTGDDVLVGWHAAHHALGHRLPGADTTGTTDLSAAFLRLAADGHVNEPLRSALHATMAGTADLSECIERLYRVGSTSGRDASAGAALGLLTLTCLKDAA